MKISREKFIMPANQFRASHSHKTFEAISVDALIWSIHLSFCKDL